MFGMIPFVKAAGRGLGALIKGPKGKETLKKEVDDLGLDTTGVEIEVDDDGGVSLIGEAVSQEMKEKIILAVGNVEGVGGVNDQATSRAGGRASQFHTVKSGDTLGAISKTYYLSLIHISEPTRPY